jgi:hypothetical protein
MIGNGGEKKKEKTHHCCLLHANREWGMMVADLIPLVD